MKHIKLSNGKLLDVYGVYTYKENYLVIEILNSTIGEVESLFTEDNITTVTVLNSNDEVENIYNGFTEIITMSKKNENIPKSYLGTGESGSGDESVVVCKVELKATDDLNKKIELLTKQNGSLQNSQSELIEANKELTAKLAEVDEMMAMILMNLLEVEEVTSEGGEE